MQATGREGGGVWATLAMLLVLLQVVAALADAPGKGGGPAGPGTERRYALVIGIGAYDHAPALASPRNDARAIAEALRGLNFTVEERHDLDIRGLSGALQSFGAKAAQADVAVLYYAGHGLHVGGVNYLVPADALLEREGDLVYEAVPLSLPFGELAQARMLGLLFLDGCGDTDFIERMARDGIGRTRLQSGFGRIDNVPADTLVAVANGPDQPGDDCTGGRSAYADALLRHLPVPGLDLVELFRKVRDAVKQVTNGRLEPALYGMADTTAFSFNPRRPDRPTPVTQFPPVTLPDRAEAEPLRIAPPPAPQADSALQLTARVTAVPKGGSVHVGAHTVRVGDQLTAEQLRMASFKPDASFIGDAGAFEFLITDGMGGTVRGAVPIAIHRSNRPPSLEPERILRVSPTPMRIEAPTDPDGDPLTVTVVAVPEHGRVTNGVTTVKAGERLSVEALTTLMYELDTTTPGPAGSFRYRVDDGHGGTATATVVVQVGDPGSVAIPVPAGKPSGADRPSAPAEVAMLAGQIGPVEPGRYVVTSDSNLRAMPGDSAMRVGVIARGTPVQVLETTAGGAWIRVATANGVEGFLAGTPLRLLPLPDGARSTAPDQIPPNQAMVDDDGKSFRDCRGCPTMVRVPPGSFVMGSDWGVPAERPLHWVSISRPFALGAYEVTVGEWRRCVQEGGCTDPLRMSGASDDLPVYNVNWNDAQAYVRWLRRITGQRYRLPSEAEWEYAARAGTSGAYWWTGKPGVFASCRNCSGVQDATTPPPVGRHRPNPFGLHDMNGGVAEWVADCWSKDYNDTPTDGRAWQQDGCRKRGLRGGSWRHSLADINATARHFQDVEVRSIDNGFRVARDLE